MSKKKTSPQRTSPNPSMVPWWALQGTTQVLRNDGRRVVVETAEPIYNGERFVVLCHVRTEEGVELDVLDTDLG
ncbi:MAG TPA: hypothetical protein VGI39_03860 [Polyangiaceae bacterium]|jgi:hypothetical protein